MPLRIKLPHKEKIIINGAVLENAGEATTIVVHNRVDLLRRKEVLTEVQANTPARRVYYSIQCAYLFEGDRDGYLKNAEEFMTDYLDAAPSAEELVTNIRDLLKKEAYYRALKATSDLMKHEASRFGVYEHSGLE